MDVSGPHICNEFRRLGCMNKFVAGCFSHNTCLARMSSANLGAQLEREKGIDGSRLVDPLSSAVMYIESITSLC